MFSEISETTETIQAKLVWTTAYGKEGRLLIHVNKRLLGYSYYVVESKDSKGNWIPVDNDNMREMFKAREKVDTNRMYSLTEELVEFVEELM